MRLPSSSSLLLATLAVSSSSSSSLSALAAPAGDGPEGLLSPVPVPPAPPVSPLPPHAPIPHGSDDTMAQLNNHLQSRNLVDQVTGSLPLPPDIAKAIKDTVHAVLGPVIGNDNAPKAREGPLDVVKHFVPAGKTSRAEGTDEAGVDNASEDSSLQPSASESQPAVSTPSAAGRQDAPVVAPSPAADCPSQPSPQSSPVRRQEIGASNGESEGDSTANPSSAPLPTPSGSGGEVGCSG
ncbi:hypothetical protein F5888DRAFT_1688719 [Russula emetica]|nr:hypothetical protein F5888DRAFT_1688719 [Russula emetica]